MSVAAGTSYGLSIVQDLGLQVSSLLSAKFSDANMLTICTWAVDARRTVLKEPWTGEFSVLLQRAHGMFYLKLYRTAEHFVQLYLCVV